MADDSQNLLLRFSRERSDEAIRALVRKHSGIVYATALRRLNGDRAAAQDVTQEVFMLLVRKASGLQGVFLSGWLHRQACRRASNYVRSEQRRKQRERIAADGMEISSSPDDSPFLNRELDDALLGLPTPDRDAILLRFFEGKDYRAVGKVLEITEEAARKRVKRALDRLAVTFKQRGVALSGGSLEATLLAAECHPPSEAVIAKISSNVAQAGMSAPAAAYILKPLLSGALAASLIAGSALAVRHFQEDREVPKAVSVPPPRVRPEAGLTRELPEISMLEAVINEIKRVNSGPSNALTKWRLDAIFDRIRTDQIPEFIALADTKLGALDRAATYEPLIKRWAKADRLAAIHFVLEHDIGSRVDPVSGSDLLYGLFDDWVDQSRKAPADWLIANWEHEGLAKSSRQEKFAMKIVDGYFIHGNGPAIFEFVDALPARGDRLAALSALTGKNNMNGGWESAPAGNRLKFYRSLQAYHDAGVRAEVTLGFWKNIAQQQPDSIPKLLDELTPAERFDVSLGMLAADIRPKEKLDAEGRLVSRSFERITDRSAQQLAATQAGEAAGYPAEQIQRAVGEALVTTLDRTEYSRWSAGNDLNFDDAIVRRIRNELAKSYYSGTEPREMIAVQWASLMDDPEKRIGLSRAAFVRLIAKDASIAARFAENNDLPSDVAAEIRSTLTDAR